MEYSVKHLPRQLHGKIKSLDVNSFLISVKQKAIIFLQLIRSFGVIDTFDEYEKRKLGIFNQLNFFQLITGIIVPVSILFQNQRFPADAWFIACIPALISAVVIILNTYRQYQFALLSFFIFYPVFTCFIYINGMNLGNELSFVLYGILSVFFLQDIGYMLFAVAFSMISYFILSIVWKSYPYQLQTVNPFAYLINEALAIVYIFYGLYLIKKENTDSQFS